MYPEVKVVVDVVESIHHFPDKGVFAARYNQMRLTAYGKTESEASQNLKMLFKGEIEYHRSKGQLAARLNLLGVKWTWEPEYDNSELPYEDLTQSHGEQDMEPFAISSGSIAEFLKSYSDKVQTGTQAEDKQFAIAA